MTLRGHFYAYMCHDLGDVSGVYAAEIAIPDPIARFWRREVSPLLAALALR